MRLQRVRISTPFLMQILTKGNIIHAEVIEGLPADAKFCYSVAGPNYVYIDFVFEHPDFKVLMMGEEIPLFPDIKVKKLYEN